MEIGELKVLNEGYARKAGSVLFASPTTVLIRDSCLMVLVDPGASRRMLLNALEREGLRPEQIDIVFVTHHHLDHLLNIRLFPDKDIYDGAIISSDDRITEYSGEIPGTNVQVIPTPGHTMEHWSLLLETDMGKVAVAGDVFWWWDDEEQRVDRESLLSHDDLYVQDELALLGSRKRLLEIADYIIPGHGRMFRVDK